MSSLEISDVRVRPYSKADDKLKAFATITFNNCFVVSDLKVIQGNSGLFVAMPSRKRKDGKFRDVAHPLNSETRQIIEDKVLSLYEEVIKDYDPSQHRSYDDEDVEDEFSRKYTAPPAVQNSNFGGEEVENELG